MEQCRGSDAHYCRRRGLFRKERLADNQDIVCPPKDGEKIRAWLSAPNTPDMFIVPYAGHAIMIEAPEIVCDVMNDFLVQLEPHLSHAWQLSYSATDKWSLKNEEKVRALTYKSN